MRKLKENERRVERAERKKNCALCCYFQNPTTTFHEAHIILTEMKMPARSAKKRIKSKTKTQTYKFIIFVVYIPVYAVH
jgi:hypothetical protein